MLHDYRKPYKRRRIQPLGEWLITDLETARCELKSLRATCLGIARRDGKPVRLWVFQIHNHRGKPRTFIEYFMTPISNDNDEIAAMLIRGRELASRH
ncbi:hypothetical protein A8A54_04385 [Brucella pseudogrignonensis]|uniref:hypothetical protein n=1 Tax=Brucella pseudogrignonensis TaxID=419475 RepID=UPI0007DA9E1D|nr:hypothetical protein [Brucella pseudogrignonensis]ANG95789.1 hypothetical protein A8A54_04385 [Brucella pseudogrignonensis]